MTTTYGPIKTFKREIELKLNLKLLQGFTENVNSIGTFFNV